MKILVTGGAGFIGSDFVAQAVEKGDEVIVLDALTYAGKRSNLEWIEKQNWPGKYELVVGNICDTELVLKLLQEKDIDYVVNFAAETHVDNSINAPKVFIETNVVGTYSMLAASLEYYKNLSGEKKEVFRYLQISTDEVFGSLGKEGYFSEETPYQPNSPYSSSKAGADHLVRAWFETYSLPTLTTNCSNNYGPRQDREKLIPNIINCALAGKEIPIYGDGRNIRDWIYVGDHNVGVRLALEKGIIGETYCLGGHSERDNNTVVDVVCGILDELQPVAKPYKEQITYVQDRLGHDRRYAIDDNKAVKKLGFKRQFTFEEGMKHTVKWYLGNI